jgi:hypothetical protein
MKNKIPIFFFIIVYFNQGFFDLSSQIIYYLTRETWHLSATMIGIIGFVTSLAWYVKPVWGYLIDKFIIFNNKLNFPLDNLLSLRLHIFEGIDISKLDDIDLKNWKIKKNIKWIKNCPLPQDEVFMRLKED